MKRSIRSLLELLIGLLILFFICRTLFLVYNRQDFTDFSFYQLIKAFALGSWTDFTIIFIVNSFFIFLYLYGYIFVKTNWLRLILSIVFITVNWLAIAVNLLDIGYYEFNSRRSNIDLFYVAGDSLQSAGAIFKRYFWIVVIFLLMLAILIKLITRFFLRDTNEKPVKASISNVIISTVLLVILFLFSGIYSKKPLMPSTALLYVQPKFLPVVQNSPQTILYSVFRHSGNIRVRNYMTDNEANKLVPITHKYISDSAFKKKNIIIVMLESFPRQFLLPGAKYKANTPFLDSVVSKSYFFTNAYATARSSNKGIMSILGSLPPYTDEPFYYSPYAASFSGGIGDILKKQGYSASFFYGAEEDHFGFEKAVRMLGIDEYYSSDDLNSKKDYDGNWGIFDEPWLQYTAGVLNKKKSPFFSVLYNISSHFPYTIPDKYKSRFDYPDQSRAQKSAAYVDLSFKEFFQKIQDEEWYRNSLFVFCADHWFPEYIGAPEDNVRSYEIPLFIYEPFSDHGELLNVLADQLDVIPTLLYLAHYSLPFHAYGTNLFDSSSTHLGYNVEHGIFQVFDTSFVLGFDKHLDRPVYLYNYRKEKSNLNYLEKEGTLAGQEQKLERHIKAMLQQFNNRLLEK